MKIKLLSLLSLIMALLLLVSCGGTPTPDELPPDAARINGTLLEEFVIVYSGKQNDYNLRAATYIQEQIKEITTLELPVKTDSAEKTWEYEILVGETNRELSKTLNADTENVQFAILANDKQVALEGDHFVIAAAAYYFVNTYITADKFNAKVPTEVTICEPITEKPNNYVFLIGDGMGVYQSKLFEVMEIPKTNTFNDGEDVFYGYMFPYQGTAQTYSLSGVTDSAAGGTALASGYKTKNENVGMYVARKDVQSLTELAGSLGMSTAVMSTDSQTGATPASFTAHVKDRDLSDLILASQKVIVENYGTMIKCGYGADGFLPIKVTTLENDIVATLDELDNNEKGFFIMYEEGHIDKHSHSNDIDKTFLALIRFNQAIGVFMEYAFYNPDTFIVITADHETGNLHPDESGKYVYSQESHSGADVPVFAYGEGAEVFDGKNIDNVQIPKTIASYWGVKNFGSNDYAPSLAK